ncbi:amidohydrolase family protein [Mucilaginibacter sp.]|uniref:amidohydrolase family protein n=1 Tax=Mucilaginibacter sp. TaxID=1882438 RepID=UPI0035BC3D82
MLKIDSHQHFWHYHPVKDAWITDDLQVIQRDFMPADVWPLMQQNDIAACVAIQADQSERETDFLIALAEQHTFIKGVVGWVDLQADNVKERLACYSEMPVVKGFRHIVQGEADHRFMLGRQFIHGISLLNQYKFTYDLLIKPQHLTSAAELVARFPDQRFVVDHIAKPQIKDQHISGWDKQIRSLATHPNVFCKISGMITEADWSHHQPEHFAAYLDIVFSAFGASRVMFGSDWPVCNLAGGYDAALFVADQYVSKLSITEQQQFWSQNAINFYGLPVERA